MRKSMWFYDCYTDSNPLLAKLKHKARCLTEVEAMDYFEELCEKFACVYMMNQAMEIVANSEEL